MIGPVLYQEMLLGSRRGRQYLFRWIYAGWLILLLLFLYAGYWLEYSVSQSFFGGRIDPNLTSRFASSFVELFVVQQLILMLLAAPAVTVGAITDEKSRGTLQYLLTGDLTPWEIVAGKLAGRVSQVGLLALAGLPVLCFIGAFGGLDLLMLLAVAAITVIPLLALGAASLLASVWSRQTRDAVLALYTIGGAGLLLFWGIRSSHAALAASMPAGATPGLGYRLLGRLNDFVQLYNPFYVLEPAWGGSDPREAGRRLLLALLAWGSIGGPCLGLAVWRLRIAYQRQLETEGRKRKRLWWRAERTLVAADPIRWKERQVEGLAPLAALRGIPSWLGILCVFMVTVFSCGAILLAHFPPQVTFAALFRKAVTGDLLGLVDLLSAIEPAGDAFRWQGIVVMLLAGLIVGIRCSGAVTGERERQTWDALLLTPLETRELIRGKLWGIVGASYPYLRAYAVPALALSLLGGGMAVFWTVVWLAVTWLALYYVGAAGIWCSTRSKSSWRSLLGTLGFSYLLGFVLYCITSPLIFFVAFLLILALSVVQSLLNVSTAGFGRFFTYYLDAFYVASCLVLAGFFFGAGKYFLADAERRVNTLERTREWKRATIYQRHARQARARRYR